MNSNHQESVPLYESEPTLESAARRIIQIEIYRNGWLGQERKSQERTVFDKFNRYGSVPIVFLHFLVTQIK